MKITEYDKVKNVHTINIIYGIGVREHELINVLQILEGLGYKTYSSETAQCVDGTLTTVHNYTLEQEKGKAT